MILGNENTVAPSERTIARESFFLDFAKQIRARLPDIALIVTGGFRTRQGMEAAVNEGACDMIGLGRPSVLNPSLPQNIVFNNEVQGADAKVYSRKVPTPWLLKRLAPKSIGAGVESVSVQTDLAWVTLLTIS